ncbi:hypothetical protein PRUPE_4G226400 [Prunus persica]|uniref:Uncharacterized protein n=1 Tax=Prunus persica TaxID=3760 RepID=A0A251PPJ6_PRUPE|nr:uncharacterized protein LOC109948835 [Prunus persica]ONI13501.1 hypothetical protein PRUPE_4G226400 [Prunus persica]
MASSSKTFLLLGFMFALVILISSEVSARELAEITKPAIPIRGKPYPFKGRPGTLCNNPYIRGCNPPPPPPCRNPYGRGCHRPSRAPAPGEYRHSQEHHEKPGLGVAETETGN